MISEETATDIAVAYKEIAVAEKLLAEVRGAVDQLKEHDLRDVFGRRRDTLELGIPSGESSRRLLRVPYRLAIPVIEVDIAHHKARLLLLNDRAISEAGAGQ